MTVHPNYTLSKLVPLVIIGILPMITMFEFVFTLGFAKVPAMPAEDAREEREARFRLLPLNLGLEEQGS